jgi:hypothetical protein
MTVGRRPNPVFCFVRPCECHLYTAPHTISWLSTAGHTRQEAFRVLLRWLGETVASEPMFCQALHTDSLAYNLVSLRWPI